jgi:hypothetical protein
LSGAATIPIATTASAAKSLSLLTGTSLVSREVRAEARLGGENN